MTVDYALALDRLREMVDADTRTQREIAEGAGMAPSQLNQVLTGHRARPSIATIAAILGALGKRWGDLD